MITLTSHICYAQGYVPGTAPGFAPGAPITLYDIKLWHVTLWYHTIFIISYYAITPVTTTELYAPSYAQGTPMTPPITVISYMILYMILLWCHLWHHILTMISYLCYLQNLEVDLAEAAAEADGIQEDVDSFSLLPNYSLQIMPAIPYK